MNFKINSFRCNYCTPPGTIYFTMFAHTKSDPCVIAERFSFKCHIPGKKSMFVERPLPAAIDLSIDDYKKRLCQASLQPICEEMIRNEDSLDWYLDLLDYIGQIERSM